MGIKTPPTLEEGQILVQFSGISLEPVVEVFDYPPPLDGYFICDRVAPRHWQKMAEGPLGEFIQVRFMYNISESRWEVSGRVWVYDTVWETWLLFFAFRYFGPFLLPMWFENMNREITPGYQYFGGIAAITALSPMEL